MSVHDNTEKHEARGKLVKRLLVIFLFLTNGVLFLTAYLFKSESETAAGNLAKSEVVIDSIQTILDETERELVKYQNLSAELNKMLVEANKRIDALRAEIERLENLPGTSDEELQKKYAEIRKTAGVYLKRMDSVMVSNENLISENRKLQSAFNFQKHVSDSLREENKGLNIALGKEVKPRIKNIDIDGVYVDAKGDEKKTMNLDNFQKLKICFDIAERPQVKKSKREIVLQLIFPDGTIAGNETSMSGTFKKEGSDKDYKYTSKVTINELTESKNVCLYYEHDSKYVNGWYKVELYFDGFMIGTDEIEM